VILVDSSVWVGKFRGQSSAAVARLDAISDPANIVLGDLILFELLQGARDDQHARSLGYWLGQFTAAAMVDVAVAISAAGYSRLLREKGVTVRKRIDVLIAAYCIDHAMPLLHQDRDFDLIARHLPLTIA